MDIMGKAIAALALGVVVVILSLGLYTLWAGGEVSMTWSNKLMRLRILAQAVAVLIVMAILYFSQKG